MAKIFSQLEKAQLENTTSDTASHPKGMITYRTDINQAKVSNGTAYKLLIDEDSTQTLSNKTYTNPVTSGAITAAQATTPANPSAGSNKLYFKADDKLYTLNSVGNEVLVGSGAGGGVKNLITNGSADDTSSSIFVPYADSGTRPVDGTGGSPTVTTSVTSSSPLDGTKSFLLTKTAVNSQGQGWAIPFTVDTAYKAKALKISVDYIVNSGTFVAGANGASPVDGDVIWYIYDVTNSQLIEPSNIKMFSNSSSLSDKFEATFQTSATGSSYRLIAHVASTSALAFELKVDNVTVSPQTYVYGSPVTDTLAWPITPTGSWTGGNVTYTGKYSRNGDKLSGQLDIELTGAPTGTTLTFNMLPFVIDTTKLVQSNNLVIGDIAYRSAGNYYHGKVLATSSTTLRCIQLTSPTTGAVVMGTDITATSPGTFTSGDFIRITFNDIPIVGWSSSVQMSDGYDARVIVGGLQSSGSTSVGGTTTKISLTTAIDSSGGITDQTNSRFLINSAGYYVLTASTSHTQVGTLNSRLILSVYKNGSEVWSSHGTNGSIASNTVVFTTTTPPISAKGGDYFEMYFKNDSGSNVSVTGSFYAQKLQGPTTIAASEPITMKYTNTAGTSMSGSIAVLPFATKSYDSHSAWDGSKFVCPTSGKYSVKTSIVLNNVTMTTGQNTGVLVYKNGVQENYLGIVYGNGGALNYAVGGSVDLQCVAGDYIEVRAYSGGTTPSLNTTAGINYVCISRIGS